MRQIAASLMVLLSVAATGRPASGLGWKTFRSEEYRYTVSYPASWYLFTTRLSPELKTLDILNFPPRQRVEGVTLKNGGAEISVGPAPPHIHTVDQWIARDTKFNTQVVRHEVRDLGQRPSACTKLTEVTSLSEVGPGRNFAVTEYYCATTKGLYAIQLLNWQGDPHQKQWQAIALKIAKSLRTW